MAYAIWFLRKSRVLSAGRHGEAAQPPEDWSVPSASDESFWTLRPRPCSACHPCLCLQAMVNVWSLQIPCWLDV